MALVSIHVASGQKLDVLLYARTPLTESGIQLINYVSIDLNINNRLTPIATKATIGMGTSQLALPLPPWCNGKWSSNFAAKVVGPEKYKSWMTEMICWLRYGCEHLTRLAPTLCDTVRNWLCYIWTSLTLQTHWTAIFLLYPFLSSKPCMIQCDLTALYDTMRSCGEDS